ncbi:hypothetical protein SAMN03080617_03369 [Algoriphagus alkaliphilus]|uniref:Uncharacterized protein n=1 Tax=Algoriphagus alkaliphilus TaxID=279824 RepID=A0A1G5Z8U6_9BACT|nr:hypothetical protein [Algoriphagus alkaliphilus]SDA91012.1 hypothetical protein SAMN03080617_03369 [Algoriphagus alkaliphilus]
MENIKFRIEEIETPQFAMLPEAYDSKAEKFRYSFGVNFSFPDIGKRIVCCSALIKYNGDVSPFLVLEVAIYFSVEENSWNSLLDAKTKQITLPKPTALHMMTLVIGTARGILHSETKNTQFNRMILPTINLNDIIDGEVVHSFTKSENED